MIKALKEMTKGQIKFWVATTRFQILNNEKTILLRIILAILLMIGIIWYPISCLCTIIASLRVSNYHEHVKNDWAKKLDMISQR